MNTVVSPSTPVVLDRVALVAAWSEIDGGSFWSHPLKEKFMRRQPALLRFILKHFTGNFGIDIGIGQKIAFSIWLALVRQGRTPIYIDAWLLDSGLRKQCRPSQDCEATPGGTMTDYIVQHVEKSMYGPWASTGTRIHLQQVMLTVADCLCEAAC